MPFRAALKLRWTKYWVLSVADNENKTNDYANVNDNIFTIKNTQLYVPVFLRDFISKRQSKLSKPRRKGLEDQFTGMNIKRKVITKIQRMNVDIFSNQILLE